METGVPAHYPQHPYVQPPPAISHIPTPPHGKWTTGLFKGYTDCESYCMACWAPCIPFGQIAHILDRGNTPWWLSAGILYLMFHIGCPCIYTYGYRKKLRDKYGLPEAPCNDCCVDCCCLHCSIAQQYRELKNRGIQPSFGFEAVRHIYDQPPSVQHMHQ